MECIDLASSGEIKEEILLKYSKEEIRNNMVKEFNDKLNYFYDLYIVKKTNTKKKIYMIIDGLNLEYVLHDKAISKKFFQVGLLAKSVICCRVSPIQKSLVVKLAKDNGTWITLSIGDGANDVPMIMEAHIGIGISGKEGTQVTLLTIGC
jgi:phospholipid-transporting ATPase